MGIYIFCKIYTINILHMHLFWESTSTCHWDGIIQIKLRYYSSESSSSCGSHFVQPMIRNWYLRMGFLTTNDCWGFGRSSPASSFLGQDVSEAVVHNSYIFLEQWHSGCPLWLLNQWHTLYCLLTPPVSPSHPPARLSAPPRQVPCPLFSM